MFNRKTQNSCYSTAIVTALIASVTLVAAVLAQAVTRIETFL